MTVLSVRLSRSMVLLLNRDDRDMYVVSWEVDDDRLMTTDGRGVVDNGAGRSGDVHKPHCGESIGVQGIKLSDGLLGGVSGIFECPLAVVLNLST